MAKLNVKRSNVEGEFRPPGARFEPADMLALRRTVACCLLWERSAQESGEDVATRLRRLVYCVPVDFTVAVAVEAREVHGLRHAPLYLARELARHPKGASKLRELLPRIITRADQTAEFLALYWADNGGRKTLSAGVKKGLAAAFQHFDAYQLAKWDRSQAKVRLRDVAFLAHPRGAKGDSEFEATTSERTYKDGQGRVLGKGVRLRRPGSIQDQLVNDALATPETWEVKISAAGADQAKKTEAWRRLLEEGQLGGLAWLRNLRNLSERGLAPAALDYGRNMPDAKLKGIFPSQFLTAAKHAPWAAEVLEDMMLRACKDMPALAGKTLVIVDVSGSMAHPVSGESETLRLEAAYGLALACREVCERPVIMTLSDSLVEVGAGPRGFALRAIMDRSQAHRGTALRMGTQVALKQHPDAQRIIVITDDAGTDGKLNPPPEGVAAYTMNVSVSAKGVSPSSWVVISGWSPGLLRYIAAYEAPAQ